jgi:hypothetical protein
MTVAKHTVMGGTYHEIGNPGITGFTIEIPTAPLTIYKLEEIYRDKKNFLTASIPIPSRAVHGLGFYDCRPSMGIFATADAALKPFLDAPSFTGLIFTDEAGLMIQWLDQNRRPFTAYPFVTVPRYIEAWSPMLRCFQHVSRIYGDPANSRSYFLENDRDKVIRHSADSDDFLKYKAIITGRTD